MLDLDHFKAINDNFGHPAGDAVLVALARLLGEHIRSEDIACRSGGEEFVVVLPRTAIATARVRAETIRRAVSALVVAHPPRRLGPITVSIGVSSFPRHAGTAAELLRIADQALYRAKRGGRNRVVVSDASLPDNAGQAVWVTSASHSLTPAVPSANINACVFMIAEKAADPIPGNPPLASDHR